MAIIRPSSDILTGWSSTGANSYGVIDEVTADNADYISASSAGLITRVGLGSTTDPGVDTGHVLRYRADHDNADGRGVIARVVQTGNFPFIVTSKRPCRSQPQVPAMLSKKSALVFSPALGYFNLVSSYSPTILGTAPTESFRRHTSDGMSVLFHPSGGSSGVGGLLYENTDEIVKDVTFIWIGTPNSLASASGYLIGRGVDGYGGGWSLELGFTGGNSVTAAYVDTSPASYSTSVSPTGLATGVHQRVALRKIGNTVSVFNWRTRQSNSTTAGNGNLRTSTRGLRLGASYNMAPSGSHLTNLAVVLPYGISDAEVWLLLDNPWQIFRTFNRTTYVDLGRKVIAERTPSLTTSPADYTIDLSEAEAANITDYSALAIEVEST